MGAAGSKPVTTNVTGALKCTLWKSNRSPCCRAVMMALDALNLSVMEVDVNMDKNEHKSPELIAMNPRQTLPIFQDNELILHDSHAICSYLETRYRNSGRWLPADPARRALTEQQMHYHSGILYPRYRLAADPILYEDCKFVMPEQANDIESAYTDLELMLSGQFYFGGTHSTLADITMAATVSTLDCLIPIDKDRFPTLFDWLQRMSGENYYVTGNKKGLSQFKSRIGELTSIQKS